MQNKYTADIGDYGKYALLKVLSQALKLGVIWYLVPDETHTNDGKFISYGRLKHLDIDLFSVLQKIIKGKRLVKTVQKSKILPRDTVFYDDILSFENQQIDDRKRVRNYWLKGALKKTKKCQIIFFDPDNGIEPKSVKPHHRKGPKYTYLNEAKSFFERGQSLVIYHHFGRNGTADNQSKEKEKQILKVMPQAEVIGMRYSRGSARVFFIILHQTHKNRMTRAIRLFQESLWMKEKHFILNVKN